MVYCRRLLFEGLHYRSSHGHSEGIASVRMEEVGPDGRRSRRREVQGTMARQHIEAETAFCSAEAAV